MYKREKEQRAEWIRNRLAEIRKEQKKLKEELLSYVEPMTMYVLTRDGYVLGVFRNLAKLDAEVGGYCRQVDDLSYSLYNLRKAFRSTGCVSLYEPRSVMEVTRVKLNEMV